MSAVQNYGDHQSEKERLNGAIQLTEIRQLTELVGNKPIAIVAPHTVFNSSFVVRLKLETEATLQSSAFKTPPATLFMSVGSLSNGINQSFTLQLVNDVKAEVRKVAYSGLVVINLPTSCVWERADRRER